MKFRQWFEVNRGYSNQEVEFVCVNPLHPNATNPQARDMLWEMLKKIPGLLIYQQDWGYMSPGQQSMCAVIKASAPPNTLQRVKEAARQSQVKIDLIEPAPDSRLDDVSSGTIEGYLKHYDTDISP